MAVSGVVEDFNVGLPGGTAEGGFKIADAEAEGQDHDEAGDDADNH